MSLLRLQKILSSAGVCSRRKAESYILNGFVSVNGKIIKILGFKADPEMDKIYVNGDMLTLPTEYIYIALNKPKNYISTCSQDKSKIVTDLVNLPDRLFPVGRLDKNSTGLLLMTNDGRIHHKISHPSFRHEKEYYVETLKPILSKSIDALRNGILLNKKKTSPAKVIKTSNYSFKITLIEGRNRQIRRMLKELKNKVLILKRIRIENIKLGFLREGSWRYLTNDEKVKLTRILNLP